MNARRLIALAVFGLFSSAFAPAYAAPAEYPHAVLGEAGGVPFTAENDPGARLTGVQIFISAGLQRQTPAENGAAALLAEAIARTQNVRTVIAVEGGALTYTVEGRSVHYYVEAPPEKISAFLDLFTQALGKPDFSAANVGAARKALISRVGQSQSNPLAVGIEMFKRSYYLNGAGQPAAGSAASLGSLNGEKLAAFYARTYKRGSLAFSAAGAIAPALTSSLEALARALPEGRLEPLSRAVKALSSNNATRIVAQRDVGAPFLVVGFAAPSPADGDFGAMLVLEALLEQSFGRSSGVTPTLTERTVSAFYLYDSEPASFIVFVNGARVEPTLALREVLLVAGALAEKPIQADALERFKTAAFGGLLADTLTVADRSYLLGVFRQDGLPADALNATLAALKKTTAADVRRVAKKYLEKYIVAVVLPRSAPGSNP